MIGTLNYETGEVFYVEEEKYDAVKYPTGKIVMILDNDAFIMRSYSNHFTKKINIGRTK